MTLWATVTGLNTFLPLDLLDKNATKSRTSISVKHIKATRWKQSDLLRASWINGSERKSKLNISQPFLRQFLFVVASGPFICYRGSDPAPTALAPPLTSLKPSCQKTAELKRARLSQPWCPGEKPTTGKISSKESNLQTDYSTRCYSGGSEGTFISIFV